MKLCILDKDGTIVKPKLGQTFVQSPTDQELLPEVKERIDQLIADDYSIVIASNQGGVESINPRTRTAYKTLDDAIAEMRYCLNLLPQIDYALFCPCNPQSNGDHCWQVMRRAGFERALNQNALDDQLKAKFTGFRKPHPGMLLLAIVLEEKRFGMADEIIYAGDRDEDKAAAEAAEIRFLDAETWRSGNYEQ